MRIYEHLCERVEQVLDTASAVPSIRPRPLNCDSFIARSILQKAIRRGDTSLALRAAATLSLTHTVVLWRRLLVTALEDLGVHELDTLARLAAAMEHRRFGHRETEEWGIIAVLVAEFCAGTRCQAANDLHNLALHDARHQTLRESAAAMSAASLLAFASDRSNGLVERNIAVLSLLGRDHAPWAVTKSVDVQDIISAVAGQLCPMVQALYEWAFKKSRLSLATASVLLVSASGGVGLKPGWADDVLPPLSMIDEIPVFALDQYTRIGRAAIGELVEVSEAWLQYVEGLKLSRSEQRSAAGELLFRAEGAVLKKRAAWGVANVLYDRSKLVGCFVPETAVLRGLEVINSELPMLNRLRAAHLTEAQCN